MRMLDHEELNLLIEKARKGDSEAYSILYQAFYDMVYYMVLQTVKNATDAEDVTQEVFLSVYKNISELQSNYNFLSWLKRICHNCCQDFIKKQMQTIIGEPDEVLMAIEDPDLSSYPGFEFMEQEKDDLVADAISKLSEDHQVVVMMKYFSEMKISEITTILGISEGTVKSRLKYSRDYLKKFLAKHKKSGLLQVLPVGAIIPERSKKISKRVKPTPKTWPYVAIVSCTTVAFGVSVFFAAMQTQTTAAAIEPIPTVTATAVVKDITAPQVANSEFSNDYTTIWLTDNDSGVDFSTISTECPAGQTLTPLSTDPSTGVVLLPPTDFSYTLYFSDFSGNIGHALVQPN